MMAGYNGDEVALGAWMYVLCLSQSHIQSVLTLWEISVVTAIETCTGVETDR
jgi:hypothetical protein